MNKMKVVATFSSCVLDHLTVEEFAETDDRMIARLKIPKKAQIIIDLIYKQLEGEINRAELESDLFSFLVLAGIAKTMETVTKEGP